MRNRLAPAAWVAAAFTLPFALGGCGGGASDPAPCAPATESCNGVDDDCDGETDEAGALGCAVWYEDADADGFGGASACLCAATAPYTAATGGDCSDANPALFPGAAETCDGIDDDCDTQVDEGLAGCCAPAAELPCGLARGVCTSGTSTCGADFAWGPCLDGGGGPVILPGVQPESCNGADDDCDGGTDEPDAADCAVYWVDLDADGVGAGGSACLCAATSTYSAPAGGDCDEADPGVHPGALELCDDVDDDCNPATPDGSGDPQLGAACDGPDADLCEEGVYSCVSGALHCSDETDDVVELCNGVDDDCSPATPDGSGDPQLGAACDGPDADACKEGVYSCASGGLRCSDETDDDVELCNGADDDCDGTVDEDYGPGGTVTLTDLDGSIRSKGQSCGRGACSGGVVICAPSQTALSCSTWGDAGAEICDGLDDDCDGLVDDQDPDLAPPAITCLQAGACGGTSPACTGADGWRCIYGGAVEVDSNGVPVATEQLCDGVDGNCSGQVDESFPSLGVQCDDGGAGACRSDGAYGCGGDHVSLECHLTSPGALPAAEICDGLDDDCDGLIDEDDAGLPLTQGCYNGPGGTVGVGVCRAGVTTCAYAAWGACVGEVTPAAAESCNGIDDDCDGQVDEGFVVGGACTVGGGACAAAGQTRCALAEATPFCDATPGTPGTESCNGIDDDCDGQLDEGLPGCCAPGTTLPCGVAQGACVTGTSTCEAGGTWGACLGAGGEAVRLPGQVTESCEGVDDDCDGRVDEPGALGCTDRWIDADGDGSGAGSPLCLCAASGPYTALQGGDCDDASAWAAPGGSEVCDGTDNDCNGVVDDLPYSLGACDGSDSDLCTDGGNVCRGGVILCVDDAAGKVEICGNGLDDDCDGLADEGCPP